MPLVEAKCPNCGGALKVDNSKDAAICEFCKMPFIVEKAINNFNVVNNNTFVGATVNFNSINVDSLIKLANESLVIGDFYEGYKKIEKALEADARNGDAWMTKLRLKLQESISNNQVVLLEELQSMVRNVLTYSKEKYEKTLYMELCGFAVYKLQRALSLIDGDYSLNDRQSYSEIEKLKFLESREQYLSDFYQGAKAVLFIDAKYSKEHPELILNTVLELIINCCDADASACYIMEIEKSKIAEDMHQYKKIYRTIYFMLPTEKKTKYQETLWIPFEDESAKEIKSPVSGDETSSIGGFFKNLIDGVIGIAIMLLMIVGLLSSC